MVSPYRLKELGFELPAGSHVLPPVVARQLHDATGLLETAEAAAENLRSEAVAAFEAEKARGYAEGRLAAEAEAVERLVRETEVLGSRLAALEGELADLVVECVRTILRGFDDTQLARSLVRTALERMRRERSVQLRVPEGLRAELRAEVDRLRQEFAEIEVDDLVADVALQPPHVILESAVGRIDLDLDGGIERLRACLRSAFRAKGGEDG